MVPFLISKEGDLTEGKMHYQTVVTLALKRSSLLAVQRHSLALSHKVSYRENTGKGETETETENRVIIGTDYMNKDQEHVKPI